MPVQDNRQIVETYGSLVYGIALARMGNKEDAEDVFQEVFLTYVRKQPVFSDFAKGRAWFAKTTIHHCRMMWRTIGRHRTEPLEAANDVTVETSHDMDLQKELARLPKKYREALVMYYFAGLSTVELAKALGVSENTIRIRMTRGRKMLADKLVKEDQYES